MYLSLNKLHKWITPTGTVITTGGIAVVATTSALLAKPFADILLKVIKPTVKKVLKKVAQIRGKKPKVESVRERRAEQRQRNEAIARSCEGEDEEVGSCVRVEP